RKAIQIEKMRTTHQAFDAIEDSVVRRGRGAPALILVFSAEEFSQGFALLLVSFGKAREPLHILQFVIPADSHGRIFCPEPAGPVARFEFLELISLRTRVEQNEIRNRAVEMTELLRENGTERGPDKRWARSVTTNERVDALKMFARLGLHRANDSELVED